MDSAVYFEVRALNGIIVRTSDEYWHKIVTFKHPSMVDKEEEVKAAIAQPDEIRRSVRSENVLLYYRRQREYYTCVVVRVLDGTGFIITTYMAMADKIKEGVSLWIK